MGSHVLGFQEIDHTQVAVVGGKGAQLGELSRIEGLRVPAGFCVTTDAFARIMAEAPSMDDRLDRLSRLKPDAREAIRALSAEIRGTLEGIVIPDDLAAAITRQLAQLGEQAAYAVRSSATAEDLPTASFAGQQDTYLNVVGAAAILQHVSRCWASLFTERAVIYRMRNGLDHWKVQMAVVVQRMVFPQAAGICSPPTPSPATGGRVRGGQLRSGRGAGLRPGERGRLPGARRRGRRQSDWHQAAGHPRLARGRNAGTGSRAGTAKGARADRAPGRPARAGCTPPAAGQRRRTTTSARASASSNCWGNGTKLGRRIEGHFGRPQDIECKDAFRSYQALTPPRVLTPDGEAVAGSYRREDLPAVALVGLPVSAGPSRGGPASSWTSRTRISKRATSWSPPTQTRVGRRCSSRSRAW